MENCSSEKKADSESSIKERRIELAKRVTLKKLLFFHKSEFKVCLHLRF